MDLATLTVPDDPHDGGREIFDPVGAWPAASSRIFIATHRAGPIAVFQVGYDPATDKTFTRQLARPGLAWSAWSEVAAAPPPTAPVVIANAVVNGNKGVLLHFDQGIDPSSVPPTTAFTVTREGDPREVVGVRISGTDVVLDLATQAGSGEIICAYTPPAADGLRGVDGGIAVAAFSIPITIPI